MKTIYLYVFLLYKFFDCVLRVCDLLSYELRRVGVELGISIYIYICIMFSSIQVPIVRL